MKALRATSEEVEIARTICGVNANSRDLERAVRQIRVVKPNEQGIIPDRKTALLKRISDMESELGRMMKLLNEMRADAHHLTVE